MNIGDLDRAIEEAKRSKQTAEEKDRDLEQRKRHALNAVEQSAKALKEYIEGTEGKKIVEYLRLYNKDIMLGGAPEGWLSKSTTYYHLTGSGFMVRRKPMLASSRFEAASYPWHNTSFSDYKSFCRACAERGEDANQIIDSIKWKVTCLMSADYD